jgi:tetratricopeptide (TPR) repeat protein
MIGADPPSMPARTEKDLSEQMRALWLKAVAAIELRNFGYAISLLQGILKQEPEFLMGRQLLRRAEIAKDKVEKKAFFQASTSAVALMKARRELKTDPKRAVELVEKILENQPYHRQANLVLKQAALAAGWPEVAVFALQTLLEEKARDKEVLHALGQVYRELGESEKEAEIYFRIAEIDPLDAEAARLGKDASARATMKTGGWSQAESYRDLIKDKATAVSLEQQSRLASTDAPLELQIDEVRKRSGRDPTDLQARFELGELLFSAGRFREALPELQRSRQNPRTRLKSMNLLGRCYCELGMLDLATQQLEEAAQEIRTMDAMQKEIVYNLGLVYELQGEKDKAIAAMKLIYQADYGYRDVAARVEGSYERQGPDR